MPAINIVDRYLAIRYTGSNSAEIDGLITYFDITSESGGVLNFLSNSSSFTANTGDWIRYTQGSVQSVHPDTAFQFYFAQNALYDDVSGLDTRVGSLESGSGTAALRAAGSATVPTLLLNASTMVAVDVTPALANTSYTPHAMVVGTVAIIGALNITGMSIVDTNTVNVTVQNTGLASLSGANILVTVTA
jgi:hypothetical protein